MVYQLSKTAQLSAVTYSNLPDFPLDCMSDSWRIDLFCVICVKKYSKYNPKKLYLHLAFLAQSLNVLINSYRSLS